MFRRLLNCVVMREVGGLFLLCLVTAAAAAAATAENKQEKLQDIVLGVKGPVGVRKKDQFGETLKILGSGDVDSQASSGKNVGANVQDVSGEDIGSRSDVRREAGGDVRVRDGVNVYSAGDPLEVQDGEVVTRGGGGRVQVDDGVDVQQGAAGVKILRKPSDNKVKFGGIKGRYSLRKKREAAEKETTGDGGGGRGDEEEARGDEGEARGDEGEASGDEGEMMEELPEPESLAWINPMRQANQGMAVENVPSLANLLGLQYREPPPPFHRPQGHPRRSPNINQHLPGAPTPNSFSRFDNGIHSFGNSFHDNFDRYYKSFNRKDVRDLPGGSGYSRPPGKIGSYSDPSPRSPPLHPSGPRLQSGGGGRPHQLPANSFPRSPYPSLSDSLLQILDPFNLFGHNQFPQLPRYPLPPPNYYTHRKQPFQPSKPTGRREAQVKNIRNPDAKYEIIVDPNQENHKGYQFREDYPLRDDLYVGQDGHIYLKDDSVPSKNVPRQKEFGGEEKPSHNPTLQGPSSDSRPHRPRLTHPTFPPKGSFEEEDIGNFDYDSGDENEEDLNYGQLLKNHNMDEHFPSDHDTSIKNTFPDSYRNIPQTPRRPPTRFDERYPNSGITPSVTHNPNLVPNPVNPLSNYGFLKWLFPSYGRVTSPNYFYNPREVLLPRFQYPGGSWSGPGVPPRTGTRLNLTGANYKQLPPLPSHPRAPVHGLSPSRPLPHHPSLRPALRHPSPSQPSLHNPSLDRHPSFRHPPGSRVNTHPHNIVKDTKVHSKTKFEGGPERGDGFYPGNGFFDSDFPTLFHMSPSQQNRAVAQLPRPLAQNATAPADQQ